MKRKRPSRGDATDRLKERVIRQLNVFRPDDWRAHWAQETEPRPDLSALAKRTLPSGAPTPLAVALQQLPSELLIRASATFNPFGELLKMVDTKLWSEACRLEKHAWLVRVWLAAASQSLARMAVLQKAHGLADTLKQLRRNPKLPTAIESYLAELRHAKGERKRELLALPGLNDLLAEAAEEKNEALLRRFRRAKRGEGKRAGASRSEVFIVQNWLELLGCLPGLCFFSDLALHNILTAFGLATGDAGRSGAATKQIRARYGLIQAGAKLHLVANALGFKEELRFEWGLRSTSKPLIVRGCKLSWGRRLLWPR